MTSTPIILAATWFFIGLAVANIAWGIVFFQHNRKLRKIMSETQALQTQYTTAMHYIQEQIHAK